MSSLLIADTTFGKIVQELPAGVAEMAREFRGVCTGESCSESRRVAEGGVTLLRSGLYVARGGGEFYTDRLAIVG